MIGMRDIELLKNGDLEAFERVYRAFWNKVYQFSGFGIKGTSLTRGKISTASFSSLLEILFSTGSGLQTGKNASRKLPKKSVLNTALT